MLSIFLVATFIVILSRNLGILIEKRFRVGCEFIAPSLLGFLTFISFFQIGFVIIQLFEFSNLFYHLWFGIICLFLIIAFLVNFRKLFEFNKKSLILFFFSVIVIAILLTIYAFNDHLFKLADVNFYTELIKKGLNSHEIREYFSATYSFQGYYQLLSSLIYWMNKLTITQGISIYGMYNWLSTVMFIEIWVFSLIHCIKALKLNKTGSLLCFLIIIPFIVNPWVLVTTSHGNTFKLLAIFSIILLMKSYFDYRTSSKLGMLFIMNISLISFSSSGLFLGGILLYVFLSYGILRNNNKIVEDTIYLSIPFAIYASEFYPILNLPLMIIYIILFVFMKFKVIKYIENGLSNKKYLFFILPIIFMSISLIVQLPNGISFYMRPYYDIVPDLFLYDFKLSFMNTMYCLFYLLVIIITVIKGKHLKNSFISFLIFIVFITFLNPLVFNFVYKYLTSEVYFRITELVYNPVIFITFALILKEIFETRKSMVLIFIFVIILNMFNLISNKSTYMINFDNDPIYHMDKKMIGTIRDFENYIQKNEIEMPITIISQIPSINLISDFEMINTIDYFVYRNNYGSDKSKNSFYNLFAPFDYPEDKEDYDYEMACSYAINMKTDFVIIDAQYYWKLEDGLWPCIEKISDDGKYRIFKIREDLWRYNLGLGYTEDFTEELSEIND